MSNPLVQRVAQSVSKYFLPTGIRYAQNKQFVSLYDVLSESGKKTRSYRPKNPQIAAKVDDIVPTGVVGDSKVLKDSKAIPMIPVELVGLCVQESLVRSRASAHEKDAILHKFGMNAPKKQSVVIEEECLTYLEDVLPLPIYRQHCIGDWRVDALIPNAINSTTSLVIEIDEKNHSDRDRNVERTRESDLVTLGFKIIRFHPEAHKHPGKQLLKMVLREIMLAPK